MSKQLNIESQTKPQKKEMLESIGELECESDKDPLANMSYKESYNQAGAR